MYMIVIINYANITNSDFILKKIMLISALSKILFKEPLENFLLKSEALWL